LYFANEAVAHAVSSSAASLDTELRDRLPVPRLSQFPTISSTYVDNVSIIGKSRTDVVERCQKVDDKFREDGIPITWSYSQPVQYFESVGVILDFKNKALKRKGSRLWRFQLATQALLRRSKVRGSIYKYGQDMRLLC
jgi:hypothetical protein